MPSRGNTLKNVTSTKIPLRPAEQPQERLPMISVQEHG
jgi:hypothetical protein